MWVRFWYTVECSPNTRGTLDFDFDTFMYVSDRETDESLNETAHEMVPTWVANGCDRYYFGFERMPVLPEEVRNHLVTKYRKESARANKLLKILGENV
jgi:hypothetical protein